MLASQVLNLIYVMIDRKNRSSRSYIRNVDRIKLDIDRFACQ